MSYEKVDYGSLSPARQSEVIEKLLEKSELVVVSNEQGWGTVDLEIMTKERWEKLEAKQEREYQEWRQSVYKGDNKR